MKAAVLIQGDARFCREFDLFLENLKGFDQVDYFMYLWKNNYTTADLLGRNGHVVVADSWRNLHEDWVLNKFKQELPEGHRVVKLELCDQESVPTVEVTENVCESARPKNMWKMLYSLYMANQARVKYEEDHNFKYDAVIRTRPDVAIMNSIEAATIKRNLEENPNRVIIPNNKRCGHHGIWMCDLFGIGTSETMTVYCDLYNQILDHHKEGTIFHPETMLGKHLQKNGCSYDGMGFDIEFRRLGKWRDVNTGQEWPSDNVPGWDNKIYISDFGRWA